MGCGGNVGSTPQSSGSTSQETTTPAKVLLEPFNYTGVKLLACPLKDQYTSTRDYYCNLSDDAILKGFRLRAGLPAPGDDLGGWCSTDSAVVFGQWLSGMARMYKATGDQAMLDKATSLMLEWGKTVDSDGRFYAGDSSSYPHSHYLFDKTVCGLVDLYAFGGLQQALVLLERITDWATSILDRRCLPATSYDCQASASGLEWYTLSENLYRAYQLTGNAKYKTFGDTWRYSTYWDFFLEKADPPVNDLHAYSHVNTLSSAAMTYAVTSNSRYLSAIINAYDHFQNRQCYATGGYGPDERLKAVNLLGSSLETTKSSFETPCGSWSIFKLARYLMMFTGEARYGDWIEKVLYNGIGAALPMAGWGQTFYYSDYNLAGGEKLYYPAAWPCCSGTYIQNIADYHNIVYFRDSSGLYVNLFVPSEVSWSHQGADITVTQETVYPESDTTTFTVQSAKEASFTISVRIPGWAQVATFSLNGGPLQATTSPGTWAKIERTWQPGDQLTVQIPMELRTVAIDPQHSHRVAIMYGPVVLVADQIPSPLPSAADPSAWLGAGDKPLEFRSTGQTISTFQPFYRLGYASSYLMYMDLLP